MLFDTLQYWLFFLAVLGVYGSLRAMQGRVFLVLASFVFYSVWDPRFVLLLAGSTAFNYFSGKAIEASQTHRRSWLVAAIVANLTVLGFFKYFNFFAASFAHMFGLDAGSWILNIVLPVGVSFITFEGIAYNVDVYRRHLLARRNLLDFALFISFFPHLVAGPIIRPHDFFPQVGPQWRISEGDFKWGVVQIVKGLFKKCVFADTAAIYANAYFGSGDSSLAVPALAGVLAFGLQIYFDFSGYTDIARGCAQLLGFKFPPNFERPYLALDISDFWRRWHISLSSWLRDYLYIPLGGNRQGAVATYRNYLIVMGLGGLWHGASWNFLIWGLFHGVLLSLHRLWLDFVPESWRRPFQQGIGAAFAWGLTMVLVFVGWIPFRASDSQQTLKVLTDLLQPAAYNWALFPKALWVLVALSAVYCWLDRGRRLERCLQSRTTLFRFATLGGFFLWLLALFMQRDTAIPFIYFQF